MLKEREMAKAKRPPMKWDSRNQKPLPYPWGLYVKGEMIICIVAYNIEQCWYIYDNGLARHEVVGVSFCVKRLG